MQASRPIWSQDSNLAIIADTRSKLNSRTSIPGMLNDGPGLPLSELSTFGSLGLDDALLYGWNGTVLSWVDKVIKGACWWDR